MATLVQQPLVMECAGWDSYRLLDSGAGRKWEAFGPHAFIRPEPQALWQPRHAEWPAAGEFIPIQLRVPGSVTPADPQYSVCSFPGDSDKDRM